MNIPKLIAVALIACQFMQCKGNHSTEPQTSGQTVSEVTGTLATVQKKFRELALANPGSTPGQVLELLADWTLHQPNVENVSTLDSSAMDIRFQSGLRAMFLLNRYGADSLSEGRGGGKTVAALRFSSSSKAKHLITNKNVLIFAPFVGRALGDLYHEGDLDRLVSRLKASDHDLKVTLLQNEECTIDAIESFGNYGLVIIDTHGTPTSFITGHIFGGLTAEFDTNEAAIKENLDYQMKDGYKKVRSGVFSFCGVENIAAQRNWQQFLQNKSHFTYRIMANSTFIQTLPKMPNTVILGNMCYSGWSKLGEVTIGRIGTLNITDPIKTAFTDLNLISYYSYGYADGRSGPLDNEFAKRMEDSLVFALTDRGDSTGQAHLNGAGNAFTPAQLFPTGHPDSPDMPMTQDGKVDYSYEDCFGTITDNRDGQKYKTACIGEQVWMAQNLRYAPGGTCYPEADCNKFGRLYEWGSVVAGSGGSTTNPSGVRGICPKDWHVPSEAEWKQLVATIGGISHGGDLKAKTDWNSPNTGATDKFGFKALPAGQYYPDSSTYYFLGQEASFWSSTYSSERGSHAVVTLYADSPNIPIGYNIKSDDEYRFSCRCVKD